MPARPEPQVDPERQHDDAMRVLRAEYYGGVRGITEDLKARVASGEIASQDDLQDAVHQAIDGSYWVIYTHANFQVLMCSDHHDEAFEQFGEVPLTDGNINWAALAFATLERDVRDQMDAEGVQVVEERGRRVREPVPVREVRRHPMAVRGRSVPPPPPPRSRPPAPDYRDEIPYSMRAQRSPRRPPPRRGR